jgi:hypothetical protein
VRFVITTVTGRGAGPEAGELVDGSGWVDVDGVGDGLGVTPAAGSGTASASTAATAASRGKRRM